MKDEFRKILVPIDGSPESEAAFPAIMPLVRSHASEVALLHVVEHPEQSFAPPERVPKACAALRTVGVNAWLELREGRPATEILRAARELKPDLIALSSHGRSGLSRMIAGSVAEAVLRRAEVPVLVTRPDMVVHTWRNIVVALDGSVAAEDILPDVVRLARSLGSTVDVIQVAFPVVADVMGQAPMSIPVGDPMPYLRAVAARLEAEGVKAEPYAPEGGATSQILRHLDRTGASLLCMTTHGRSGLDRLLLGSVAESILRHSPCPVYLRRIDGEEGGLEAAAVQGITVA